MYCNYPYIAETFVEFRIIDGYYMQASKNHFVYLKQLGRFGNVKNFKAED